MNGWWVDHAYDSVIRSDPNDPWWRVHYQYRYSVRGQRFAQWTWMEVRAKTSESARIKVESIIARDGRQLQVERNAHGLNPCWVEAGKTTEETGGQA